MPETASGSVAPASKLRAARRQKAVPTAAVERSLNAAIDRAAHAVLPRQPYLVSVPSDVPYRHSARFVPTWFVGTPFDRSEEQLQYLSFLPHQDEEEELLHVVGGWSDPDGSVLDDEASGHATPQGASARKKISLQDYNKVTTKGTNKDKDTSNLDGGELKMRDDGRQRLPDLLSPLLPPSLVKAIATPPRANNDSTSNTQHLSITSVPAPPPPTNKPVAALAKPATPSRSPARSPRPRQRHVIALRYGKKNRKRVEALLKFAPRPRKTAVPSGNSDPRISKDTHPPATTTATPIAKAAPLREAPSQVKRPSTPLTSIKEPAANASSAAKKPLHATPKKDFKSTAMRRVESVEDADPSTPADKGRGSTPLSSGGAAAVASRRTSPGPTSAPQPSHEDRHTWYEIYQAYFALGRSIKHNATDDHKRGSPAYAVRLVEALLAFMISNAAQTLARPSADVWGNITEYFNFVLAGTDDFRSLHGLVMQLGAVCRQHIQRDRMDRLARDPLPEEYVGSAPTPGSDGTTKTAEDGERYKSEYVRNKNRMIRNARELDVLWLEGSKRLSPELLKNDYPKTWQARRLDYEHRTRDRPTPALLPKGYFLPLDAATTPFEAVRYGLAFLTEWADVHSLQWQPRIDLDQPDRVVLKSR
ncbi:hypothetical protein DV737_g2607, partial [Chaetothyriales sp. CBS 132003]